MLNLKRIVAEAMRPTLQERVRVALNRVRDAAVAANEEADRGH